MLSITHAAPEQAALVHRIMIDSYAEFLGVLNPPSGAHTETVDDVLRAMTVGGALLAWLDGEPAASARYALRDDHFYIGRLAVLPVYRGQRIASEMILFLETIAREEGYRRIQLAVRAMLPRNLELYQRLGYQTFHVYAHEKGDGSQLVHQMAKEI
jgi:ribosomal protein S18 acetylase RimI-like enzyme